VAVARVVAATATATLLVYRWISQVKTEKMDMWTSYRVRGGTMTMWSEAEEEEEEAWEKERRWIR
jgi:hypothetical protein